MNKIREVPLRRVQITDDFWSERQRIIAETAVPYMEKILRDEVPGAEKSHAMESGRIPFCFVAPRRLGQLRRATIFDIIISDEWLSRAGIRLPIR